MSIQIGVHDSINDPRNRIFNNERLKLFSDVQSNLIELSSACNETTIVMDKIQIGSSNNSSNFMIDTFSYGDTTRLFQVSKDYSAINSDASFFNGSVTIKNDVTINGRIINNFPIQSDAVICCNIQLYANPSISNVFFISSNSKYLVDLNTVTNRLSVLPNVGIGTTVSIHKLHVDGNIYTSKTVYTSAISSNLPQNPDISVYGNLNVFGSLTTTKEFNLGNNNVTVAGINIQNIAYDQYSQHSGLALYQERDYNPFVTINAKNIDSTTTEVFGISSTGRTFIGSNINTSNSLLTLVPSDYYKDDSLCIANSYGNSNGSFVISKDAYLGIGTTMVQHAVHIAMNSNMSLSNMPMIGLYQDDNQSPFLIGYSNQIPVFTLENTGSITIGSNIYLSSNGTAITQNLVTSNITTFDTIYGSNIIGSNIWTSNIASVSISSSNLDLEILQVVNRSILKDVVVTGILSGPSITNFNGISTGTLFEPDSHGPGSLSHLKSSNVIVSILDDYTSELSSSIAENYNAVLQVRTYSTTDHIPRGISVYGNDRSSMMVTAVKPYYQIQKLGIGTGVYNIGINNSGELYFGKSNYFAMNDYTNTLFRISNDTVTIGNGTSSTLLYAKSSGSILVSTKIDEPADYKLTNGFEVKGSSYFRGGTGTNIMFLDGTTTYANIGIGNSAPKQKVDITGNMIVSGNIGIGNTTPRQKLDVIGNAIISANIGIGTTLPRKSVDIIGDVIISSSNINNVNINSLDRRTRTNYGASNSFVNTWYPRGSSIYQTDWTSICWASELSLFCGIAYNAGNTTNNVIISSDSVTWTIQAGATNNQWTSVCWARELGIFCAVASSGTGNRVMTSPNGITWTSRTSAADNEWNSVCWSPDLYLFCAVASSGAGNRVMTSPNGTDWTTRTSAADNSWTSICWSPELKLFCAVAKSGTGNRVMTSSDGVTWTSRTSAADSDWYAVCWSPDAYIFCAVGNNGAIMTSPDGVAWTSRTSPVSYYLRSICWSSEMTMFCVVGTTGAISGTNKIIISPDGINWTAKSNITNEEWSSICWSRELSIFAGISRITFDTGTWPEISTFSSSGIYGACMDMTEDGLTLVTGAPNYTNTLSRQGAIFVYTRSKTQGTVWTLCASYIASSPAASDYFGSSVAISEDGSTIVVGAPTVDTPTDSGAVYMYTRTGTNPIGYAQNSTVIRADPTAASDNFGSSVSINRDGTILAVGSPLYDISSPATNNHGAAYIFSRSTNGNVAFGLPITRLQASDYAINDRFGKSISLSSDGNTLAVGARFHDLTSPVALDAGSVYIFTRSGSSWSQLTRLQASDASSCDQFGWSVSLNSDGTTLAIGVPYDSKSGGSQAGSVYVFTRTTGNVWNQQTRLQANDAGSSRLFGYSLAINSDGTKLAISGTAGGYYFTKKSDGNWYQTNKIKSETLYSSAIDKNGQVVAFGNSINSTIRMYDFQNDNYITTSTSAMPNVYNTPFAFNSQLKIDQSSGNVGIGTTVPRQKLDIFGDSIISGNVGIGTTVPRQKLDIFGDSIISGNVGIGTTVPRQKLDIFGDSIISGNVGIGTTLPRQTLDIVGTIQSSGLTASTVLVADANKNITSSAVSTTTLSYLDASSSIQTQLNNKQATINGGATTITSANLTADRALISDASGKVAVSSVSSSDLTNVGNISKKIARAWFNVDTSGTNVTIKSHYNIASITKTSTGNITIDFDALMPNDKYAAVFGCGGKSGAAQLVYEKSGGTRNTSRHQINFVNSSADPADSYNVSAVYFAS